METFVDIYLQFPSNEFYDKQYETLCKYFDCVEGVERHFGIEFSCGDGKYMEDLWQWSENNESLYCTVTDEQLERYDGNVDLTHPPRFTATKEIFKHNTKYRFTVKYSRKREEVKYFINNKLVGVSWAN